MCHEIVNALTGTLEDLQGNFQRGRQIRCWKQFGGEMWNIQ